jgi:alkanesulfonate monooxygenase SsuD/methylene tetrahydromethanopterin reductase-like flavin-dependent oxidoreductase (luciferase family)
LALMKFGIEPTEGGHFFGEVLAEATRAEELGFDSVWLAEHHGVRDHYWPSPLQVLTALAPRTSRITLGTNVVVFPFYHPVRLAEEAAWLDALSGGRLVLGVAIGYRPDEFALYGAPLEKRGARLEEGLALVKALWTGDRVTFRGKHFAVENARIEPKPLQRPHPRCGSAGGATSHSAARPPSATPGCPGRPPTSPDSSGAARRSSSTAGRPASPDPRASGR